MDEVDRAALETELRLCSLLSLRDNKPDAVATGFCLNCDEPLEETEEEPQPRWCDSDCRDDWEKRSRLA